MVRTVGTVVIVMVLWLFFSLRFSGCPPWVSSGVLRVRTLPARWLMPLFAGDFLFLTCSFLSRHFCFVSMCVLMCPHPEDTHESVAERFYFF